MDDTMNTEDETVPSDAYNPVPGHNQEETDNVLQEVWARSEEKIESKWDTIASSEMFQISPRKVKEITEGCTCDRERLERVIEFWLMWYPYASWRWWIEWFGDRWYTKEADMMRKYAEPITDPTLTVTNVASVLSRSSSSGTFDTFVFKLAGRRAYLDATGLPRDEYNTLWSKWWLSSYSNVSWEYLAQRFYCIEDNSGVYHVKKYLNNKPDPTLTATNINSVLAPIKCLDIRPVELSFFRMNMPLAKFHEVYVWWLDKSRRMEFLIQEFLEKHPAPSWKKVARSVYRMACHKDCYDVLEAIHWKYLNRLNLQNLCILAVRSCLKNPSNDVHHLPIPERLKPLICD